MEPPPVAALFEVVFDQKVGYTLGWKRSLPEIDLDGVEFKCLPSGLHSVKEDLVYFVHGTDAGVSAFVQEEADEQHRNAKLVCVGALVPLTYGRLGKSWRHAAELRRLAKERVQNEHDSRALELYWLDNRQDEAAAKDATPTSPSTLRKASLPQFDDSGRKQKRARSDASANLTSADDYLTPDHPALFMNDLLHTFGPLIFPLHRAALLRKRILLLGSPPVQPSCNFVYDLSILSSIPQALTDIVELDDTEQLSRVQALFSVGVHDIPYLSDIKRQKRWLACTTDDILGEKKDLYDILVKMPSQPSTTRNGQFPQILTSDGKEMKATQRDLRRYRLLRSELSRTAESQTRYRDDPEDADSDAITPLMRASTTNLLNEVRQAGSPGDHLVCEPVSWTAMAYNGFMWWASAGEMEAWENEEASADRQLLDEIPEAEELLRHIEPVGPSSSSSDEETTMRRQMAEATALTAYFHRLTAGILQPLADLVEDADDETIEGVTEEAVEISNEDVRTMGLDVWSAGDREFVVEAAKLYFGREAEIQEGTGVRVCGVRIC